jgi:hypothetical protein
MLRRSYHVERDSPWRERRLFKNVFLSLGAADQPHPSLSIRSQNRFGFPSLGPLADFWLPAQASTLAKDVSVLPIGRRLRDTQVPFGVGAFVKSGRCVVFRAGTSSKLANS